MKAFSKVLVANRGEIACRVIRAARALGYDTVAVFSDADAHAPHVALADQAVCLGTGPAADSYLRGDRLRDAALRTGADALHPGYGFLSENADFADACTAAGLVFIGPPGAAIRLMGDKAQAKARMREASVPTVPGFWGSADSGELHAAAQRIGYPLLVKATAGGGGRGIRVVRAEAELADALTSAAAEAASAFGDARVMLERFVEHGRHVEVQVFADAHGHVLHFGERDCTAQRRRQKVIEESPSPIVSDALRARMGEAAVAAARAVDYRGAGTIEFIVDQAGEPYFLEMNTRLQVEHPVTELVTGLDLVRLQLLVAAGEPLTLAQADVRFSGHAIEARLYTEDPYDNFSPQTGRVLRFETAAAAQQPGVRFDVGVEAGSDISPFYDGMVAKVIAHGATRAEASRRLARALAAAPLFGLRTNARFLRDLLASAEFREARMHTAMLDEWQSESRALLQRPQPDDRLWALAFALYAGAAHAPGLRSASARSFDLRLTVDAHARSARVSRVDERFTIVVDGQAHELSVLSVTSDEARFEMSGVRERVSVLREPDALHLASAGAVFVFREPSALRALADTSDPTRVRSPLSGTLARVAVEVGAHVVEGDLLLAVEAMKMEVKVLAGTSGIVTAIHRLAGEQVDAGELLLELTRATSSLPSASGVS